MRFSVTTKNGEGILCLKDALVITEPSEIILESATVYWNYNNISNDKEDFVTVGGTKISLEHGYYNFDDLKGVLENHGVDLVGKTPTGKCEITVGSITNFEELGVLLGLPSNTELTGTSTPDDMVNINRGLRRISIECDIVDRHSNIGIDGQPSKTISNIPIPTDKTLKGTLTHHMLNSTVKVNRGTFHSLKFNVTSNVERYAGDVFLELYIKHSKRSEL